MGDKATIKVTFAGQGISETLEVPAHEFSTGSRGFWGTTKLPGADDKRYQVSVSLVEIGSKPPKEKKAKKAESGSPEVRVA